MHLVSVLWFCCYFWFAQNFTDGWPDIDTTSVTITDTTGGMGSFEQHQSSGGFSGDSQPDPDGPTLTFLTPDLLERSWRSLEPSSGLKLPWETGVWSTIFGKEQFGFHDAPGIQWTRLIPPPLQQVEGSQRPAEIVKRCMLRTIGDKLWQTLKQLLGKKIRRLKWRCH